MRLCVRTCWTNSIRISLLKKIEPDSLKKYVNYIENEAFEFNYLEFTIKEANSFALGGFLVDSALSEEQIKSFINENGITLETITNEYVKKIKEYERK